MSTTVGQSFRIEKGLLVAISIISLWFITVFGFFQFEINWWNPLYYLACFIPAYLYTGLFITAHEAWHGNISHNRKLNRFIGVLACTLFAYNAYDKIQRGHHKHHADPASDHDPEFSKTRRFFPWLFSFTFHYLTIWQFLLMSVTTTVMLEFFNTGNIILYYLLPTFIATLQLFYFGTYLPHRGEYENKHQSGTQKRNHIWAFITCYFFGYHYEHHYSPKTPWYQLPRLKEEQERAGANIPSY